MIVWSKEKSINYLLDKCYDVDQSKYKDFLNKFTKMQLFEAIYIAQETYPNFRENYKWNIKLLEINKSCYKILYEFKKDKEVWCYYTCNVNPFTGEFISTNVKKIRIEFDG